jgi:hypothetical protein
MNQQTNLSITSSISLEEAQTAAILSSKRRHVNVLDLKLYGCYVENIVIVYGFACLNECFGFRCVYGCTAYYVNLLCGFCNYSCVGYSIFCKKNKPG